MADDVIVTANRTAPKIAARDLTAAGARLFGTIVLDVADMTCHPAIYNPRTSMFVTLDGAELGEDDGSLIVLVLPGTADDLIADHGGAAAAARALTRTLRAGGAL